jgi:hypothetical protein
MLQEINCFCEIIEWLLFITVQTYFPTKGLKSLWCKCCQHKESFITYSLEKVSKQVPMVLFISKPKIYLCQLSYLASVNMLVSWNTAIYFFQLRSIQEERSNLRSFIKSFLYHKELVIFVIKQLRSLTKDGEEFRD